MYILRLFEILTLSMVFLELQEDDVRSSGSSSPESTGSVETSISSHFGGMNYPSLFSSRPTTYGASQPSVCIMQSTFLVNVVDFQFR